MHTHPLVIAGLAADICIQLTAMDADLHGDERWTPEGCAAAESPTFKRDALDSMARVLKADVRSSSACSPLAQK